MNKMELRSRLAGMVLWLEEIISGASEQTCELEELVRFQNELKRLIERIDDDWNIDWPFVAALMKQLIEILYIFSSK